MSTDSYLQPHLVITAYSVNEDNPVDLGPVEFNIQFPAKKTELEIHCHLRTTRHLPELMKLYQYQTGFVADIGNPLHDPADRHNESLTHLKQGLRFSSSSDVIKELAAGRDTEGDYTDLVIKVKKKGNPSFSYHILENAPGGATSSEESTYNWDYE